jgi:hypothetical protein
MGIESRDWYRDESRQTRSRGASARDATIIALVVFALIAAVSPQVRDRLGYELPFGLESVFRSDSTPGAMRFELVPGGPGITLGERPLYAPDDPRRAWLAGESVCPRGEDRSAPPSVQVQAMLCLLNFARRQEGLAPLGLSRVLSESATRKTAEIIRCNEFAHEVCGRPADESARHLGHQGPWGENLYIAEGPWASPRLAVDGWLNSDGHRENLFQADWRAVGIALLPDARVEDFRAGTVWVNQFGG